jgi:5-hydroxyisourate hydrolase-like protein (transthyretin family)
VVYVGSFDNNTYALNAATGAKLWNYTTGDSVSSSSAVVNGVVYVGSWDMNVYAIGNKSMSTPTTLTAAAPSSASVNQNFTINGTLNAMLDPVGGATITLQQNESGTWNNITTTATDTNGSYQFSNSESAAGTYQYRTTYAGNASYTNATSYTVTVQVTTIPTQLSAAANITTAYVGQNFAINGTLNTTNGTAIAGAIITLQKNVSWAWTNVATNVTDANGTYQFSDNESVAGSYQYRTTYAGNAAYINATSNTVSVQVTTIPTQLSAAANLTTAYVNQNFTINGTLNSTDGTAIAGATITLQKNVSGTWQNVTGNTASTTSTGAYGISTSESAAGTYQYRAVYAGNATFGNATSNAVAVTVSRHSTTLSATVSTNVVAVNKPFSINGRLRSGATGLAGATITLQRSTNNATWNNVTSATTSAAGEYQFSRSESSTGTYQYRTVYGGNVTYANATSNVVSVKVTSKASVLADLNRLELTVVGMPSSAFTPGTKIATLAVISAAEINVRAGNYGAATNELQRALLARTDGCSATAKPDNNDWVRTCAAQAQLYPQVQNLIQELQALQGS